MLSGSFFFYLCILIWAISDTCHMPSLTTHMPMILIFICPAQISVLSSDKLAQCPLVLGSWPCCWHHEFNTSQTELIGFCKICTGPRSSSFRNDTVVNAEAWKFFFFYFLLLSNASPLPCCSRFGLFRFLKCSHAWPLLCFSSARAFVWVHNIYNLDYGSSLPTDLFHWVSFSLQCFYLQTFEIEPSKFKTQILFFFSCPFCPKVLHDPPNSFQTHEVNK